jgi:hypothetical protein
MPALGIRNSTNEIYLKQIREYLDEDKNIYKNVFEREKEQVATMQQNVIPKNTDISQDTNLIIEKTTESFTKKLEEINNALIILISGWTGGTTPGTEKYKDVLETYDPIIYYNSMMRAIVNPSLQQTVKTLLENKIMKSLPFLDSLIHNYNVIISKILDKEILRGVGAKLGIVNLLPQLVSALSLYKLMENNINNRNYKIIDIDDVKDAFTKTIIRDFPTLKEIDTIKSEVKRDINPLLNMRYNAFKEEFGRDPTPNEKLEIAKQYDTKNMYNPIFSNDSLRALENYRNTREDLHKSIKERETEQQMMIDEYNDLVARQVLPSYVKGFEGEIDDYIATQKFNDPEYTALTDEFNDLKDEYSLIKKKKGKKTPIDAQKITDFEDILSKIKQKDDEYYIMKRNEVEKKIKEMDIKPIKGKGKKTYLKRKANTQMDYNEFENEAYAH